jgi:hypothetical protein
LLPFSHDLSYTNSQRGYQACDQMGVQFKPLDRTLTTSPTLPIAVAVLKQACLAGGTGVVSREETEESMKTNCRFWLGVALVGALAGVAEAKIKPKKLATIQQGVCSIALDATGNPHVAYQGMDHHLYHARFDGRKWQHERIDTNQYSRNALAIDAQGHIHIVYGAERTAGSKQTYPLVHAYFNGTSWHVTDLPVNGHHPRIALDVEGHLHVLFNFSSQYGVYDGANWQFEDTGLSGGGSSDGLALDSAGRAHIAANNHYATNKSGVWESTNLVSAAATHMAIAVTSQGLPRVAAVTMDKPQYFTYDGTNWTSELLLDHADWQAVLPPGVTLVLNGVALALDKSDRPQLLLPMNIGVGAGGVEICVYSFYDGIGWSGMLLDTKNAGFYPSLAVRSDGVAYGTYCTALKGEKSQGKWARIALSDLTGTWTNVNRTGSTVTGTLTVTNRGVEKSLKTIASLWLSEDATLTTNDTPLLVSVKIKSLKPGASVAVPVEVTYPGTLAGKYLFAVIDPNANTADRNLLDNQVSVLLGP